MAAVDVTANRSKAVVDDLDRLFGHDPELDDVFQDPSLSKAAPQASTTYYLQADSGLGIDEAVEVERKVRAPRVKLDENK